MKLVQKILNSLGEIKWIRVTEQGSKTMMSDFCRDLGLNREIKIHIYRKRQTSDSRWEFLRIENKQIKTVPNDSYG